MNSSAVATGSSAAQQRPGHKRSKSATVLKSIMVSKNHKRTPTEHTSVATPVSREDTRPYNLLMSGMPLLPSDHPAAGHRVLGEVQNLPANGPTAAKAKEAQKDRPKSLHKKTLSTVSLRSLGKEKEVDDEARERKEARRREKEEQKKLKKNKSSTSLSAAFARSAKSSKSSKGSDEPTPPPKDKENTTPPSSAATAMHTPIWAEFSSQRFDEVTITTSVPLNDLDLRHVGEEIALYTPQDYSPSKQRNFGVRELPSLQKRAPRPKSAYLPSTGSAASFMETISRKLSNEHTPTLAHKGEPAGEARQTSGERSRIDTLGMALLRRSNSEKRKASSEQPKEGVTVAKRGNRVMAAVAALNGKVKEAETAVLDEEKISTDFEAMLDSRNIPDHMRPSMRALTLRVKADLVKQNQLPPSSSAKDLSSGFPLWEEPMKKAQGQSQARKPSDGEENTRVLSDGSNSANTQKRSRPRSKTFTFSKGGSSPTEKQDSDARKAEKRSSKLIEIPRVTSSTSLAAPAVAQSKGFFSRTPKPAVPEDFVSYLRKVQQPQIVEVGKLHKLRLLLRNETVAWVDSFIRQGGMTEIVSLLHRIMQVEWREEHEDALLHEALLCLKGLCTTGIALEKLCEIEATLFPALLAMLFDDEHKGPSEFTTRKLIIDLLFAHVNAAVPHPDLLSQRVQTIISYLRDPQPTEDRKPVAFVLEMHTPRPYRVWSREVSNVTKEVFWIFLHHLNVIPLPPSSNSTTAAPSSSPTQATPDNRPTTPPPRSSSTTQPPPRPLSSSAYLATHFPKPRPPIPTAPYVGGVEWDSTHYLSSHLDLLNGLLACLPTAAERNAFRQELRASGWEKTMGTTLRTCKEKFYAHVHEGLKTWVAAAVDDGWDVSDVRCGIRETGQGSPRKSPVKSPVKEKPPQIEAPRVELPSLRLGLERGVVGAGGEGEVSGGWLTPPTIPTNGETVIEWAKSFADIITTVAALGASLTFTVIVSDIADPKRLNPDGLATEARFDRETVRKILAIGWLLFVTAFGWAVLMSLVVRNASPKWIASYNRYDKTVDGHEVACNTIRWLIAMLSLGLEILGLEILITAAFMYLGFAVGYTSSQLNWPL
ncbi:hypothetical protein H2199_008617 [Coniosporium tulheliwenetii]|uniref:Uncharacterized protein n=1 Tax=Coniosporium tulheliwenetii TaxID=3383036 RepID=A0ACC2YIM0_9PEZI|nr:hypothetical protein H2199_008617 [Cladosporium sp. JES 115]